jgi:hypothetical protein
MSSHFQYFAAALLLAVVPTGFVQAQARFVYPAPAAETYRVTSDVPFARIDTTTLAMDVYLPMRATPRAPAIIFWSRSRRTDEMLKGWARHAAANGIVGVIPDARGRPFDDILRRVVAELTTRVGEYGIDSDRLTVFAASAGVTSVLPAVEDSAQRQIKAAVMFYGTADVARFRRDLPVLFVRAGLDHPEMNAGIFRLVSSAIAQDAPITLINNHLGRHNFELYDDDVASRQVIDETLAFVKRATDPDYQRLLRTRVADAVAAAHLSAGEYREAVRAYSDLLAQRPTDGLVRLRLAESLLGNKQFGQACDAYRGYDPPNFAALMPGSRACVLAGMLDSTVAWLGRFPKGWVQADAFRSDSVYSRLWKRADFQALFPR